MLRVRIPSLIYRLRLTRAASNRRLTEVLVEALRDDEIFDELLARTDPTAPRSKAKRSCTSVPSGVRSDALSATWASCG
jgi:hypothetical protein